MHGRLRLAGCAARSIQPRPALGDSRCVVGLKSYLDRLYSSEATGYSYKKKGRNFRLNLMDSELDKGKVAFLREDREGRTKHILPPFWLRDNCQCPQCVDPVTKQKTLNTFEIPQDIQPKSFRWNLPSQKDPAYDDQAWLSVKWPDGHKSVYPRTWLRNVLAHGEGLDRMAFWKELWYADGSQTLNKIEYNDIINGEETAMTRLTQNLIVQGYTFVDDTPVCPKATQELLEKIGPIRQTHYGGFYDFEPNMAMADSAYSNAALPPHTDTTYFTEPAGLQAFHMLSHTPPPEGAPEDGNIGGQSFLVDGFAVTNDLWRMDKSAFRALTAIPVPWHASGNEGVAIAPEKTFPVIELKDGYSGPIVSRIRWNESDRGSIPLTDTNGRLPEVWYNAARKFNRLVENQKYRFQLQPRRVLIFDNWRVLHGRDAFVGQRRMCGAYISRDDFMSTCKLAHYSREHVIAHNMNLGTASPSEKYRAKDRQRWLERQENNEASARDSAAKKQKARRQRADSEKGQAIKDNESSEALGSETS